MRPVVYGHQNIPRPMQVEQVIHQFLFGIASLLTFVTVIVCMLLGAS